MISKIYVDPETQTLVFEEESGRIVPIEFKVYTDDDETLKIENPEII